MPRTSSTFERVQAICDLYDCAVQDLFLVGDHVYIARAGDARSLPLEHQPFLLDDLELAQQLPEFVRGLGARTYASLDELRDQRAQCEEFHEIFDALYDALTEFSGGVSPDDDPLFLPGGYQGFPGIQLHLATEEFLTVELIERLQVPLMKYARAWVVTVTSGEAGGLRTIAEVFKDRCAHVR